MVQDLPQFYSNDIVVFHNTFAILQCFIVSEIILQYVYNYSMLCAVYVRACMYDV